MRFLFVFAPNALEWPLAVIERLTRALPGARFHGVVVEDRHGRVSRRVHDSGMVEEVLDITRLEAAWISGEAPAGDVSAWEKRLGPGALNRILLADPFLSAAYVQADVTPTPLARAARSEDAQRAYVCAMLEAFDGYLARHAVDCVFSSFVDCAPHLALAELCRVSGLRFLRLTNARTEMRYVIDDDPRGTLATVHRCYRAARTNPAVVAGALPEARAFLADFRRRPRAPRYMMRNRGAVLRNASVRRLVWRTVKLPLSLWRARRTATMRVAAPHDRLRARLRQSVRARLGQRRWLDREALETLGRFAFYPLHVEPEASTRVMAPTLPNQLAVIEALSKSLPLDMTLVVKEHPTMVGRRPGGFYDALSRLPRCRLVDPAIPGVELVGKAALTCVISSTAAWEAMLLGRPALVLGDFPFAGLGEGLVSCSDFVELPSAVAKALAQSPAPERSLELFLAAVFRLGFRFPPDLLWGRVERRTVQRHPEIADAMAEGIVRVLQMQESAAWREGAAESAG